MKKKYRSEILQVVHGMAEDLREIGAINDARMKEYDTNCLAAGEAEPAGTGRRSQSPVPAFAGAPGGKPAGSR